MENRLSMPSLYFWTISIFVQQLSFVLRIPTVQKWHPLAPYLEFFKDFNKGSRDGLRPPSSAFLEILPSAVRIRPWGEQKGSVRLETFLASDARIRSWGGRNTPSVLDESKSVRRKSAVPRPSPYGVRLRPGTASPATPDFNPDGPKLGLC